MHLNTIKLSLMCWYKLPGQNKPVFSAVTPNLSWLLSSGIPTFNYLYSSEFCTAFCVLSISYRSYTQRSLCFRKLWIIFLWLLFWAVSFCVCGWLCVCDTWLSPWCHWWSLMNTFKWSVPSQHLLPLTTIQGTFHYGPSTCSDSTVLQLSDNCTA